MEKTKKVGNISVVSRCAEIASEVAKKLEINKKEYLAYDGLDDSASDITFPGGAISSPCPRYELIPLSASTALANRFSRGIRLKGSGAWNALSANQADVVNKEFVLNRLGHAIKHAQEAVARLAGTLGPLDAEEAADGGDAGAIMFAGALLAEYVERGNKEKKP